MPIRIILFLFLVPGFIKAQSPRVPARMEFADIKLRIMEGARKEIQTDVDALTRSPKYFNIKLERAKSYFPIIERVFREEGLHEDFKYLVLQESALIPDAVSSSDAVGFWQFKDFTAMEVGLRVDKHIDERMDIVASTRGAATYMKRNNEYFDNWLHTLQAYQMGAGGAMRALGKGDKGAKSMVIDKKTYWYVKKFLAHKIAFENAIDGPGIVQLREYTNGANKTLKDISEETGVGLAMLQDHNKWLRKGKIPDDKNHTVIIPITKLQNVNFAALEKNEAEPEVSRSVNYDFSQKESFPQFEDYRQANNGTITDINGLPGVIGKQNDKILELARKGGIDLSKFLKYNDIEINNQIQEGQVYYFKHKKAKAKTHYYVLQNGESLWSVSQKFGIKLKKLKTKNRIKGEERVRPGRVLWLRFIRPARIDIEYREVTGPDPSPTEFITSQRKSADPENNISKARPPISKEKAQTITDSLITKTVPANFGQTEEMDETIDTVANDNTEPAGSDNKADQRNSQVHIVKPGETLYSISKVYDVTIKELLDLNHMDISQKLSIDQKLLVYNNAENMEPIEIQNRAGEKIVYHTVSQGETLYSIARKYDVTIEDLMTWNNRTDFNIDMGDKIKIRKKTTNN